MARHSINDDDAVAQFNAIHTSVYDFAKTAIQALVAVSSGGFITTLATAPTRAVGRRWILALTLAALIGFGSSVLCAVTCACLIYLNQYYISFWSERRQLAQSARLTGGLSLLGVFVGGTSLLVLKVAGLSQGS